MPHHNPCGGLECEGGVWPNPKTVVHRKGWKTADWRGKKIRKPEKVVTSADKTGEYDFIFSYSQYRKL